MKKKQKEAVASREQRKKIRQTSGSSKKSWSSNAQKMKETDPQDNKELTGSTGPIMNYEEGYNIPEKEHKINSSEKTDNSVMIYNVITAEVYVNKQKRIKPESSDNHKTYSRDIYLDKPK